MLQQRKTSTVAPGIGRSPVDNGTIWTRSKNRSNFISTFGQLVANFTIRQALVFVSITFILIFIIQYLIYLSQLSEPTSVKYHIVFSTGCSVYQDWQSYIFFYQAYAIQQRGTITRIVSGCNEEQQQQLQKLFDEQIRTMVFDSTSQYNDNFRIHFTPDYSHLKSSEKYVYFNKPYGMKHWLENELGFSSMLTDKRTIFSSKNVKKDDLHSIVVLLDPDQIIMRKWENNVFNNTDWKFLQKDAEPRTNVTDGYPMGQLYGYDLQWKQKINMTTILNSIPKFAAGITTPIDTMSDREARAGYVVGPPYVATASDMYKIVVTWSQFVVPVHDQYPHLLAEMFAYSLAAAHLKLHHQTAASFMVTDTDYDRYNEGWGYVDDMPVSQLCSSHRIVRQENVVDTNHPLDQPMHVANTNGPWVFHYCQRYSIGPYMFGKGRMGGSVFQGTFLSCDLPLFAEPPSNVYELYNYSIFPDGPRNTKTVPFRKDDYRKRSAFTLCYILPFLNDAAIYYKQKHCIPASKANYTKSVRLALDDA